MSHIETEWPIGFFEIIEDAIRLYAGDDPLITGALPQVIRGVSRLRSPFEDPDLGVPTIGVKDAILRALPIADLHLEPVNPVRVRANQIVAESIATRLEGSFKFINGDDSAEVHAWPIDLNEAVPAAICRLSDSPAGRNTIRVADPITIRAHVVEIVRVLRTYSPDTFAKAPDYLDVLDTLSRSLRTLVPLLTPEDSRRFLAQFLINYMVGQINQMREIALPPEPAPLSDAEALVKIRELYDELTAEVETTRDKDRSEVQEAYTEGTVYALDGIKEILDATAGKGVSR